LGKKAVFTKLMNYKTKYLKWTDSYLFILYSTALCWSLSSEI